jgi:hypothetical protein
MPKPYTPENWKETASLVAASFRFTPQEKEALVKNKTAQLVAALPYLAGCEEAERTSLAHLGTFVLASREPCRRPFDHKKEDDADPLRRLAPIADFKGGDRAVIERGMALLAIVMTNGYRTDVEGDRQKAWYNPVGSGAWKADAKITELSAKAAKTASPEMDSLMTTDEAVRSFWDV